MFKLLVNVHIDNSTMQVVMFKVFGGDSTLMQVTSKDMYVDSSRAVDISQSDMKKSMQQKSKEAKKFAKVLIFSIYTTNQN